MIQDTRQHVAYDHLWPSKTNPRKTFDPVSLEELAQSMREHGVISSLLVRPHPKKSGQFEIVVGERRWRGGKIAGLKTLPVDVRTLTDAEVEEIQEIENVQREDVLPLEEAESLVRLLKTRTLEQVATKTGKSKSYIAQRAKLTSLSVQTREAFQRGCFQVGIALELAKYSDEQQDAALDDFRLTSPLDEGDEGITVAQVRDWLTQQFTLKLKTAPFDTSDAELVPAAGTCGTCPKRTGNQGELFGDVLDACTDRACFAAKSEATYAKKLAEPGARVLEEDEAKKVFQYGRVNDASGYVALDDVAMHGDWNPKKRESDDKTFRDALVGVDVPIVLARKPKDGRGETMPAPIVELVRREDLEKIAPKLKAKWAKEAIKEELAQGKRMRSLRGSSGGDNGRAAEERRKLETRAKQKACENTIAAIVAAASKKAPTEQALRVAAKGAIRMAWSETQRSIADGRGLELTKSQHGSYNAEKVLLELADKMKGPGLFALLVEVVIRRDEPSLVYYAGGKGTLTEVASVYKVNHGKFLADAKKEAAALAKERAAKKAERKKREAKKAAKQKARAKAKEAAAVAGVCSKCGCTDSTPCSTKDGPCAWANMDQTLCTGCVS